MLTPTFSSNSILCKVRSNSILWTIGLLWQLSSAQTNNCSIPGTNTYLIGRGADRILIDTGEGRPSWQAALRSVLATEAATIKQAILTHWHHDHTDGVPDLLEICPDVKIYKKQPKGNELDIEDGQVFAVEGATLRAFHAPGHTTDHMVFCFEEENAMFTGDSEFSNCFYIRCLSLRWDVFVQAVPRLTLHFASTAMYCYFLSALATSSIPIPTYELQMCWVTERQSLKTLRHIWQPSKRCTTVRLAEHILAMVT